MFTGFIIEYFFEKERISDNGQVLNSRELKNIKSAYYNGKFLQSDRILQEIQIGKSISKYLWARIQLIQSLLYFEEEKYHLSTQCIKFLDSYRHENIEEDLLWEIRLVETYFKLFSSNKASVLKLLDKIVIITENVKSITEFQNLRTIVTSILYNIQGFVSYKHNRYEKADQYFNQAIALVENQTNFGLAITGFAEKFLESIYYYQGIKFKNTDNSTKAIENLEKSLQLQKKVGSTKLSTLRNLAEIYWENEDENNALIYYNLCLKKNKSNTRIRASILNNIGLIYAEKGEYTKSLNYLEQGLEIRRKNNLTHSIAKSLNNIGNIYRQMDKLDQALDFYKQSLEIKKKIGNKKEISRSINNIGHVYHYKGDLQKALKYYKESLSLRQGKPNERDVMRSFQNIGKIYRELGELDKAMEYYQKASKNIKKKDQAHLKIGIADILVEKGEFSQALDYYQETLMFLRALGNKKQIASILYKKSLVYIEEGKKNELLDILKEFPKPPYESPSIIAMKYMIEAMIEQIDGNFGLAKKSWKNALQYEELAFQYQFKCLESLTELAFEEWRRLQSKSAKKQLDNSLNRWISLCQENKLLTSLCKALLVQSKIYIIDYDFASAEQNLQEVRRIARENSYSRHLALAERELEKLSLQGKQALSSSGIINKKYLKETSYDVTNYIRSLADELQDPDIINRIK